MRQFTLGTRTIWRFVSLNPVISSLSARGPVGHTLGRIQRRPEKPRIQPGQARRAVLRRSPRAWRIVEALSTATVARVRRQQAEESWSLQISGKQESMEDVPPTIRCNSGRSSLRSDSLLSCRRFFVFCGFFKGAPFNRRVRHRPRRCGGRLAPQARVMVHVHRGTPTRNHPWARTAHPDHVHADAQPPQLFVDWRGPARTRRRQVGPVGARCHATDGVTPSRMRR
jgi:hypothetical protein